MYKKTRFEPSESKQRLWCSLLTCVEDVTLAEGLVPIKTRPEPSQDTATPVDVRHLFLLLLASTFCKGPGACTCMTVSVHFTKTR